MLCYVSNMAIMLFLYSWIQGTSGRAPMFHTHKFTHSLLFYFVIFLSERLFLSSRFFIFSGELLYVVLMRSGASLLVKF